MSAQFVALTIQWLHYLALSFWIGGIFFLSLIAAPSIHRSVVSKPIAGQVVGKMLKRFNRVEIFCFLTLLGTVCSSLQFRSYDSVYFVILLALIFLMGANAWFYGWPLTRCLETIKENTPGFDALEPEHPERQAFKRLHKLYVRLMSLNLLMGFVTLWVSGAYLQ